MSAEADAVASMLQLATKATDSQEQVPHGIEHENVDQMRDDDIEMDNPSDSSLSDLGDGAGSDGEGSDAAEDDLSDIEGEEEEEEEDDEEDADNGAEREEEEQPDEEMGDPEDEGEDTEAETERLHDSPEKLRSIRNVHHRAEDQLQLPEDNIDQTSEISALSESVAGDMSPMDSPVSSPRKRKRDELESEDEQDNMDKTLQGVSRKLAHHVDDEDEDADELDDEDRQIDDRDGEGDASDDEQRSSKEHTPDDEISPKLLTNEGADAGGAGDAEVDGEGEGEGEAEAEARPEEDSGKKESALFQLRGIEKDFARLRDELFSDKMQQLNNELDLLHRNPMEHSGYAAAIDAIDRRREEQVRQARVTLDYKIKSLQNKSVAERAMAHSQYMQDVRGIRDDCLAAAGDEWYRIQKSRRLGDADDEFEKRYHFNPDRLMQVSRQTAYNQEVSLLSGIQKHVGFPAAPEIEGASQTEVEDDLKKMGISGRQKQNLPISAPISSFPRQMQMQTTADEHFLKANPWADPQNAYAAHAQMLPQAQQFTTPAIARQAPQGSASTIAISSVEQTPMSGQAQPGQPRFPPQVDSAGETPSRVTAPGTVKVGLDRSPHSSPLKAPHPQAVPVQTPSG